jgi:DNA-directed RNA polymerase specialized sigma subunit
MVTRIADGLGLKCKRGTHPSDRCGNMLKAEVYRFYDEGKSLSEIAAQAGVSHQAISRIILVAGLKPRREILREQFEKRKQERAKLRDLNREIRARDKLARAAAKKKRLREYMKDARRMWSKGKTIAEIAKAYGIPLHHMSWNFHFCRKNFKGWLPYRRKP